MLIQDKFSQDDCITIANFAIQALKAGIRPGKSRRRSVKSGSRTKKPLPIQKTRHSTTRRSMRWMSCGQWETQAIWARKKVRRSPCMSFLPPSGGVVRLAPFGGPGRVFHADGRSVLKVQTGRRKQKIATQTDRKTLPSREASSSVLCSDSICSKTAPIALNALRIEPKYLYGLFSIFNCLVSLSWTYAECQQFFATAKQVRQVAAEQAENFGKTLNTVKYRDERRG